MAERTLGVWCFDRRAGTLVDTPPGMELIYDAVWLSDAMPPLSQSLPLDGSFGVAEATAFFGGLLPEGAPRELLARRLGLSTSNDFGLLAAVAGDTAGAITLTPGDEPSTTSSGEVAWLDDHALAALVAELPERPMHADDDGEYRLSLAGAQDKLPVVVDDGGRIGLTKGQTPSTHILKTPIERLDHTVVNEAFCPAVGRTLGIDVAEGTPRRIAGLEFLLVPRYDRRKTASTIERLHQEDFCQALGIPTSRKYQSEAGPSLADCFALLRRATDVPAREIVKLVDYVALSFLLGNHDAHGKDFSLLYAPSGVVLAPAYDVLSTFAYRASHNLSRRMAMSIGGEYRPDYVRPRHLDRMLGEAGLGAAAARRRLRAHAIAAPTAARTARAAMADTGWDAPVLERIVDIVDRRAEWLVDLTMPTARTA